MTMNFRPELDQALRECRQSMAALKVALHAVRPPHCQKPRSISFARAAGEVLELDKAYTDLTDTSLKGATAPSYGGPLYEWGISSKDVRKKSLAAIERVRRGSVGLHPLTGFIARNYFASIWPEGAAWPDGIERPDTS